MRVIVGAFACRPASGSETGVGWAVAAANARLGHDTVLVTQPRHRDSIESALRDDPALAENLHPMYIGLPARLMQTWDQRASLRGLQIYNLAWQVLLARMARRLHRSTPFDVGHHVTLSTDWVPSGLAQVPGLPVVWGPLGGSERVPLPCRTFLGFRGRTTELLRTVVTGPIRALLARPTARRCALLVAQNDDEAEALQRFGRPVEVRPNVFLDHVFATDETRPVPVTRGDPSNHRAVFAGRLLAWKGVHAAVAAMSEPPLSEWTLAFYGDGPERRRLEASVARRGLQTRVTFLGARPRAEVRQALTGAAALFFPSMREAAGWVVAEALAVGCPVVCLNVGGPPLLIGAQGIAVDPGPALPARLAEALASVPTLGRTVVRWDETALSPLLTEWYSMAAAPARLDAAPA